MLDCQCFGAESERLRPALSESSGAAAGLAALGSVTGCKGFAPIAQVRRVRLQVRCGWERDQPLRGALLERNGGSECVCVEQGAGAVNEPSFPAQM